MPDKKILLVTGASSDVGSALIKEIAKNYSLVWAHYCQSKHVVDALADRLGDKVIPIQADFSDTASTEKMIGTISASGNFPDHIVHIAAQKTFVMQFHKCEWSDYQNGIDTSLRSAVMILQSFIPRMRKEKYGKVVLMLTASTAGSSLKFMGPYIAVKYALLGLMRNLAAEYADKRITVNAVSPDMMETKFLSKLPDWIIQQNAGNHPLGRNVSVEDVVPVFAWLLSDRSNLVTGQNISVTGGAELA